MFERIVSVSGGILGIGILTVTLFILTRWVVMMIPSVFMAIKNGVSRGFKDIVLLIFLIFILGLFIYDWYIFFYNMYLLVSGRWGE